ncbi:uncharacterized protein TNCV_3928591 [Trichonephila clavipes]|nr:uncharacterized protein TNCV_3928591 [Trichonephila clavipes]
MQGHSVTVNGDRYRAMITNFFLSEWNNHDVQELCFQQDGSTCHTARATIDLLKDTFGDRLISRFGPVNWPPRSCDLTRLDYFLPRDIQDWMPGVQDSLCKTAEELLPENSSSSHRRKATSKLEDSLATYVVMRLRPCSDSVQMLILCGDLG